MRTWALTVMLLAAAAVGAQAQPPANDQPPANEKVPGGNRPNVQQLEIGTVYLRDKNGNLVLVPGKSLEEISRALEAHAGGDAAPPKYSLDRVQIRGKIENNAAICEVTLAIRVREPGWVQAPIRLEQAVLREQPRYEGPGKGLLAPTVGGPGYTAWLQGNDEKPHVLKLTTAIPVAYVGDEARLSLTLPRATEGSLTIETKHPALDAELRTGDGIVNTKSIGGKSSECQVVGGSGDLLLIMRPAVTKSAAAVASMEVNGEITVKVESQTRITADARLRVRGLGKPVETFRVRLPVGMEYISSGATGYSATVVDTPTANSSKSQAAVAQVVEIKLDRPTSGVVDVRLATVFTSDERKAVANFEPGRFEVLGANRQRGTLDLIAEGDWSLKWTEDGSTHRVDLSNEPTLAARLAARFEYLRQPCGLKLQVTPRATRVNVEPTYIVHISQGTVRLEALLRYRLRGAKANAVSIDLGDWKLARVTPETIVEAAPQVEGAPRSFTFIAGQTSGDVEIQLEAWQELPEKADMVRFQLPRPLGDVVAPALLVISPADNIELTPKATDLHGLTPEASLPPSLKLPSRQQPPLLYRDLSANSSALFAAELTVREQRIAAGRRIKLNFLPEKVEAEAMLLYRVSHAPARSFRFEIPTDQPLADAQVYFAGQSLPMVALEPDGDEVPAGLKRYQVNLPSDQLGPCEFNFKFVIPLLPFVAQQAQELVVPLPRAVADDELTGVGPELTVHYADPLTIDLESDEAGAFSSQAIERTGPRDFRLPIGSEVRKLHWRVSRVDRPRAGSLILRKTWRQTWLTADQRRDRVAFRVLPSETPVHVQLPDGVDVGGLAAAVDGQQIGDLTVDDQGEAIIAIAEDKLGQECTLELWYGVRGAGIDGRTELTGASIPQAGAPGELYWQVLLPEKEHLLLDPPDFTPDMNWGWRGMWWRRQGSRNQRDLETWSGASRQQELPAAGNHLLFASFGAADKLVLRTIERRWLLLVASGLTLVIGLALIHVPAARHPAWLLLVAVVSVSLTLGAPELGVLIGQAAGLGAVCVLIAMLWRVQASPRPARQTTETGRVRLTDTRRKELALARSSESSQPGTLPIGIATAEPRP